jgi:hypothetical protein
MPVPGRDIMVQAWYQGGVSVFDFTDSKNPSRSPSSTAARSWTMSNSSPGATGPPTGTTGEQAGPTYSARAVETRVFGETAVITFTLVAATGDDEETRYFNTGVFRRDSDHWRAIAWQATKAVD